jgi:adenine phosphoribosyltransferase
MVTAADRIRAKIRNIPDFPKKGIVFRDITTLLQDPETFRLSIDLLAERFSASAVSKIVGIESRGFIFGGALAERLGAGFVPVRKPGKLPFTTIREEYKLEYGTDTLEIHTDAIRPGERVVIMDDLIATGGTIVAACNLVKKLGGHIAGCAFCIELSFLGGRNKLSEFDVFSIVRYDSE